MTRRDRPPTVSDPRFGEIPLIDRGTHVDYDLDYKPPMPKGAVRADPHLQNFCPMCDRPKYFYVDEPRTCVQCGNEFTFGAKEQKYWYETLRFIASSVAIRCPNCRRQRRTEHALRQQLGELLRRLETKPRDPATLIELAKTTVEYRERTGQGDLDRAIAACRIAATEWPGNAEPLFWEARCHQLAGRVAKARALYRTFLEGAKSHLTKLVRIAERELQ